MAPRGERPQLWLLVLLLVSTLLFVEALRSLLASSYAVTLSTLGLNAGVLWLFLLLAPVAYPLGLCRLPREKLIPGLAGGFLLFRSAMAVPMPLEAYVPVAALASAAYLLLLPPLLARVLQNRSGPATAGASLSLAVSLDLAFRILGLTADPGMYALGLVVVGPSIVVVANALFQLRGSLAAPTAPPPAATRGRRGFGTFALGLGLGLWLAVQFIALAQPALLARWSGQDYNATAVGIALGAGVGALWLARRPALYLGPRATVLFGLLPLLFLLDMGFGPSAALSLTAFLASLAAVVVLARLLAIASENALGLGGLGAAAALAGLVFLLAVFVFVFTLTYAHVPARSLWQGRAGPFLATVGVLLFLAAMAPPLRLRGPDAPAPEARRGIVTVVSVAIALSFAGLAGYATGPIAAPASVLTAMTYNIHQGFGADGRLDLGRIAQVIASADPDLVALQESDTVRVTSGGVDAVRWLARALGYHEAYGPPSREQTYGVAILSRFPIESWRYVLLPSVDDQRALVEVHVTVRGVALVVFAAHIGLDRDERQLQAGFVLNLTASVPGRALLMGDFNSCPTGTCPEYGPVTDTVYALLRTQWNDSWVDAGHPVDDATGYTFDSLAPFERIDYIFTRGAIATQSSDVVGPPAPVVASDHRGVVATFLLP